MTQQFQFREFIQKPQNTNSKEYVYHCVHCSVIYNSQDLEAVCPLVDEWIKKLWYIYTMEYYSAV